MQCGFSHVRVGDETIWYAATQQGKAYIILQPTDQDITVENSGLSHEEIMKRKRSKEVYKLAYLTVITSLRGEELEDLLYIFTSKIISKYEPLYFYIKLKNKLFLTSELNNSHNIEMYISNLLQKQLKNKVVELSETPFPIFSDEFLPSCILSTRNEELWHISAFPNVSEPVDMDILVSHESKKVYLCAKKLIFDNNVREVLVLYQNTVLAAKNYGVVLLSSRIQLLKVVGKHASILLYQILISKEALSLESAYRVYSVRKV